jgi:hypothetical protein
MSILGGRVPAEREAAGRATEDTEPAANAVPERGDPASRRVLGPKR